MPEQEIDTDSLHSEGEKPWWVRLCRWLWEISARWP